MDMRRIALIVGLAVISYVLVLQWSNDYSHTETDVQDSTTNTGVPSVATDINESPISNSVESQSAPLPVADPETTDIVRVSTPTLEVVIDLVGGDIIYAALPQYPLSLETPDIPFKILETQSRTYTAQSGLVGEDGVDTKARVRYQVEQPSFELGVADSLEVVLSHVASNGLIVNKVFTFTADSYVVGVRFDLTNSGTDTLRMNMFGQLRRDDSSDPASGGNIGMSSYLGPTFSTDESSYEKVKFSQLKNKKFAATNIGGWVALLQHYFLSAWVPNQQETHRYYGQQGTNGLYYVGFQAPTLTLGPGETATTGAQLYVGPKIQTALEALAPNLEKTVDYGWLWWVAQPIFLFLTYIQGFIVNWGWSIVVLTLLIKLAFYPLTASSYRSMAKMRKFAPMIQELRDQYGDDRQKMSQEMMKMYQKEKLNPLGGCLPMLVQMPIFIALYWVLMESVELRQSPFIFWIVDLSLKDPYFVLPLLMGASMFLQMRMQQQPTMDPMQQRIMQWMPVMFTFMFLWFPAGLTLYWFVNNVITIIQQWYVNRRIDQAEAKTA